MKKLAILVSISLVIGIPLLYGYENLNRIKIEEVSTTTESNQLSESDQSSNWEEEVNRVEKEFNKAEKELDEQERLENDIKVSVIRICVEVNNEVSKGMIVDCLVDVHGLDRELVSEVIDNMKGVDWKYNCKKTFESLLNEGHEPNRIPLMLEALQFTDEEIQYAIDNH